MKKGTLFFLFGDAILFFLKYGLKPPEKYPPDFQLSPQWFKTVNSP